jgi:hypothetical protein
MSDHVTRVQIPVYEDRWMMGDRYGTVVKITVEYPGDPARRYEVAHVLLDKSNKVRQFVLADCEVVS